MQNAIKLTAAKAESMLMICLLAAFAAGAKSDTKREAIRGVAESLPQREKHDTALFKRVLLRQVSGAQGAQTLIRRELSQLAYEMAVCVCEADHVLTQPEKTFLQQLQQILELDTDFTAAIEHQAEVVTGAEIDDRAPPAEINQNGGNRKAIRDVSKSNRIILNYAILDGALESMPQLLATMKLSSQVLEGYISKLFGGLLGKLGGKLLGSVGNRVTDSAQSFAVTFAIVQMTDRYYTAERTMRSGELRRIFEQLKA